jgi:GNAT superfamily N-acetyltransferase
VILRRATLDDMTALARLHRRTVQISLPFLPSLHSPQEDAWWFCERLYATNEVWLAEDEGGPVGYIAFRPDFIEHLFIQPEAQSAGLGLQLLEKAKQASAERARPPLLRAPRLRRGHRDRWGRQRGKAAGRALSLAARAGVIRRHRL